MYAIRSYYENARLVVLAVLAAAVTVTGVSGWRWYQQRQSVEAGRLYETLNGAARGADANPNRCGNET